MSRRRGLVAVGALGLVAVVVIGIGQAPRSQSPGPVPAAQQVAGARARAPAAIRALYANGDALRHLQGDEFVTLIRRLRGHPVVINKWASWCGPCRKEFPMLRRLSATYADRVAFVGLNAGDSSKAAHGFLRENPTLFPHVRDPEEQIARALRADGLFPSTIFLDRDANIVTVTRGPFASEAKFDQAIRRYALARHPVRP